MLHKILLPLLGASVVLLVISFGLAGYIWIVGVDSPAEKQAADLKAQNMEAFQAAGNAKIEPVPNIDAQDHLWGRLDAPAKLIAYMDFDCPFSTKFFGTLAEAKEEFGDDLVVALRHYPLESHPDAEQAARAAECADEQDLFWEYAEILFREDNLNHKAIADLNAYAEEAGLSAEEFADCLQSDRHESKIAEDKAEAKAAGMLGSPSSSLNGRTISGAYQMADFTDPAGDSHSGLRQMIKDLISR